MEDYYNDSFISNRILYHTDKIDQYAYHIGESLKCDSIDIDRLLFTLIGEYSNVELFNDRVNLPTVVHFRSDRKLITNPFYFLNIKTKLKTENRHLLTSRTIVLFKHLFKLFCHYSYSPEVNMNLLYKNYNAVSILHTITNLLNIFNFLYDTEIEYVVDELNVFLEDNLSEETILKYFKIFKLEPWRFFDKIDYCKNIKKLIGY